MIFKNVKRDWTFFKTTTCSHLRQLPYNTKLELQTGGSFGLLSPMNKNSMECWMNKSSVKEIF